MKNGEQRLSRRGFFVSLYAREDEDEENGRKRGFPRFSCVFCVVGTMRVIGGLKT